MQGIKAAAAGAALAFGLTCGAWGQQAIVYPAKGQTPQQQAKDTSDCQLWAKQNTGVDPVVVAQQLAYQPPPPEKQGEVAKGAVGGAVVGGLLGGIGGRGGEGAAAGAVVGVIGGKAVQNKKQQQYGQQQQQAQQQAANQMATYNRAFAACMQGHGYTIS